MLREWRIRSVSVEMYMEGTCTDGRNAQRTSKGKVPKQLFNLNLFKTALIKNYEGALRYLLPKLTSIYKTSSPPSLCF